MGCAAGTWDATSRMPGVGHAVLLHNKKPRRAALTSSRHLGRQVAACGRRFSMSADHEAADTIPSAPGPPARCSSLVSCLARALLVGNQAELMAGRAPNAPRKFKLEP
jgi:hypothetical protein